MNETTTTTTPYLLACQKLGIEPRPELADTSDKDLVAADAYYRLTICIRAKNMLNGEVRIAKYDGTEDLYEPRFKKSGSGWASFNFVCWDTRTVAGPRLAYFGYDLMREGVKEFDQYYQALNN